MESSFQSESSVENFDLSPHLEDLSPRIVRTANWATKPKHAEFRPYTSVEKAGLNKSKMKKIAHSLDDAELLFEVFRKPSKQKEDIEILRDYLIQFHFFQVLRSNVCEQDFNFVVCNSQIETYEQGDAIYEQNEINDNFMILLQGKAFILLRNENYSSKLALQQGVSLRRSRSKHYKPYVYTYLKEPKQQYSQIQIRFDKSAPHSPPAQQQAQ